MTDATITENEATGAITVTKNGHTAIVCAQPGWTRDDQIAAAVAWAEGVR